MKDEFGGKPLFDPLLAAQFRKLLKQTGPFPVMLTSHTAVALLSELDLALRHPQPIGTCAELVRAFMDTLFEELPSDLCKMLKSFQQQKVVMESQRRFELVHLRPSEN